MTTTNAALLRSIKQDCHRILQWVHELEEKEFVESELHHYAAARVLDQIGLKCSQLLEESPSIVQAFPEIEYWSGMDEHVTRSPVQTPQAIADIVYDMVPKLAERMDMLHPEVI